MLATVYRNQAPDRNSFLKSSILEFGSGRSRWTGLDGLRIHTSADRLRRALATLGEGAEILRNGHVSDNGIVSLGKVGRMSGEASDAVKLLAVCELRKSFVVAEFFFSQQPAICFRPLLAKLIHKILGTYVIPYRDQDRLTLTGGRINRQRPLDMVLLVKF